MTQVSNKLMIEFLFNQMEKLDKDEIDVMKAREQGNLAKQVNNAMKYELDRAKTKMELTKHNTLYKEGLDIRDVESKDF